MTGFCRRRAFGPAEMPVHTAFPLSLFQRATRGLAIALLVGASLAPAFAARQFPQNSIQAKITAVGGDAIVADGKTLHLAPGVLVFTANNSTLVRSAIPVDTIVRLQIDLNGDVRRIWLLNDDEILVHPWYLFWKRDQPQPVRDQPQALPAPSQ